MAAVMFSTNLTKSGAGSLTFQEGQNNNEARPPQLADKNETML
jgi:hypothetical protein